MADIVVTGPDGSKFTFPEGTGANIIHAAMNKHYGTSAAQPDERQAAKSWSEVPGLAVQNAPASAKDFASNIYHAVTNPVQTITTLGDAAAGGLRAGAKRILPESVFNAIDSMDNPETSNRIQSTANAVGQELANRYGGEQQLMKTLSTDPVGALADTSAVLTGGGGLAARAPGIAGRIGETVATAGRAVDPINLAGKGIAAVGRNVVEPVVSNTLGATTGVGAAPIRQAAKAGFEGNTTLLDHMRGNAPASDVVDMAKQARDQMKQEGQAAYRSGMVDIKNDKSVIDFAPINTAMDNAVADATFGSRVVSGAKPVLEELRGIINDYKNLPPNQYHTPEGLNFLKKEIGDVLQRQPDGTIGKKLAGNVYNAVKDQIVQQAPAYAKVMKGYQQMSEAVDEAQRTFSLGSKASQDTALRKLQSVMRNNVNANYGQRAAVADQLAQYQPNLMPAIAGQSLSSAMPRGLASAGPTVEALSALAGHPQGLLALPFQSPRLVGEASYKVGQAAGMIPQVPTTALQALYQAGRADQERPRGLLGQ